MNQPSFYKIPIRIIIDATEDLKQFKVSVAFISRPKHWSAKFKEFDEFPTANEVNQTIKKGFAYEQTGAVERFGMQQDKQFEKSFN
ncbi:MAG: hypothetical protein V4538_02460 [Bacteroidota bacterium]